MKQSVCIESVEKKRKDWVRLFLAKRKEPSARVH
jgi:hypothetical protein